MVTGKIALFGGVGSGKTEALKILKNKYHARVIEADKVAHKLYKKNAPGYKAIMRICGKSVLDEDRNIDRKKLADLLYSDSNLLEKVNSAIHPMVYKRVWDMIDSCSNTSLVVYEAALLPKHKLNFIDYAFYVYSDYSVRVNRLKLYRAYSDERISEIFEMQPKEEEYRAVCDYLIPNNGTLKELEDNIDETLKYCKRK